MAAVIDIRTGERVAPFAQPRRPELRLVEGGRNGTGSTASQGRAVSGRTYFIRRLVALAAAMVVVLVVAQVLATCGRLVVAALDPPPEASGRVHTVRQGETVWGIAGRYAPSLDRREAVDDLLALNGGDMLRPGRQLRLPASFD